MKIKEQYCHGLKTMGKINCFFIGIKLHIIYSTFFFSSMYCCSFLVLIYWF